MGLIGNKLPLKRRIKPSYCILLDPAKTTLGQRPRYLRKKLSLGVKDLSPKVGLAESAIARIERDEGRHQPWVLGRILAFLASGFKKPFPETAAKAAAEDTVAPVAAPEGAAGY